jgi:hypothetical protein
MIGLSEHSVNEPRAEYFRQGKKHELIRQGWQAYHQESEETSLDFG